MGRMDPYRFEQLVVDLLFAMGYGGSRAEAAQVTQKSNDGGIDGIISEDRLGLDVIYVQAKRWQSTVGREPIQSFVGALAGRHANKGVFITTSDFNSNALDYVTGGTASGFYPDEVGTATNSGKGRLSDEVSHVKPRQYSRVSTWMIFISQNGLSYKFRKDSVLGWGSKPRSE